MAPGFAEQAVTGRGLPDGVECQRRHVERDGVEAAGDSLPVSTAQRLGDDAGSERNECLDQPRAFERPRTQPREVNAPIVVRVPVAPTRATPPQCRSRSGSHGTRSRRRAVSARRPSARGGGGRPGRRWAQLDGRSVSKAAARQSHATARPTAPRRTHRRGQLAGSDASGRWTLFLLSSALLSKPSVAPKIAWPTHQLQCGVEL